MIINFLNGCFLFKSMHIAHKVSKEQIVINLH